MSESEFKLTHPPIVEAVLDLECDIPPGQQLAALEGRAKDAFRDHYPKFRTQFLQEVQISAKPDEAPISRRHGLQAFQFLQEDEKQLVQLRTQGFSFNRLSPYSSLDDYLPEIERSWRCYIALTSPVQVRVIRLRYINRVLLPLAPSGVKLEDYLQIAPRLPDEERFVSTGFLTQHAAMEIETGHHINMVLTSQPQEGDKLPIIFDNGVASGQPGSPDEWPWILDKILSLRVLKNRIFRDTLTEKCLNLFRQP